MGPGSRKGKEQNRGREKNAPKFAECDNKPDPSHKRVAGWDVLVSPYN
jgi:hypothetical protein